MRVDERVLHVLLNVEHGDTVSSLSFRVTCSVENHTTILDRTVRGTDRNLLSSRLKPNVLRVSTGFELQHRIVLLDISLLNWGRRSAPAARQIALKEARLKANEIIEQAHQRANQIVDAAKAEAIVEAGRQKALAEADIAASANRAREELRHKVAALAVTGAEKMIRREIDASTHKALFDELAAEL